MKISDIYVYPIKSLRPCRVQRAKLTRTGFEYDRKLMLLKVLDDGSFLNLHVGHIDELCLFGTRFLPDDDNPTSVEVTFNSPDGNTSDDMVIEVPLVPDYSELKKVDIIMHKSPGHAYDMGDRYSEYFSTHLKFPTRLVYLGDGERPVLGNVAPNKVHLSKEHPEEGGGGGLMASVANWWNPKKDYKITFADIAPFLITTKSSLAALGKPKFVGQEPPNLDLDMTKLRPNIVLEEDELPEFDEDYWAEIEILGEKNIELVLTANCGRCKSLNVDYTTGKQLPLDQQMLKKLASMNRRIDSGMKWTPVFGRYGFLKDDGDIGTLLSIGQEVTAPRRNDSPNVFYWPGMST